MAEVKMPVSQQIDRLPGNSNASKEAVTQKERPKMKRVTKGPVKTRKQGLGRKLLNAFISEDVDDVKSYVIQDVLIPTIRATIYDMIEGSTAMMLLGRAGKGGRNRGNRTYVDYSSRSNLNNQTGSRAGSYARSGGSYSVEEVVFGSRSEAEDLLDAMIETMREYDGIISVADYYDMAGVRDGGGYTDNYWGWKDLGNASVRRIREGYLLSLPRPISIK